MERRIHGGIQYADGFSLRVCQCDACRGLLSDAEAHQYQDTLCDNSINLFRQSIA